MPEGNYAEHTPEIPILQFLQTEHGSDGNSPSLRDRRRSDYLVEHQLAGADNRQESNVHDYFRRSILFPLTVSSRRLRR